MKKALFIIPQQMFRDEEYFEPKVILEKNGITVITASQQKGSAKGKFGKTANADISIKDVIVDDYSAILFIGGPGCYGAICAAPGILANANVLSGKKATMFADDGTLAKGGATYTGKEVEVDGNIITATGPAAANAWAEAIVKMLKNAKGD
ncbi:MAG: protease I [Candidatus Saganbacteria bacterium]|uniref:Protease I n=1 Tax=Candidatus Saganbacteria bacterium TaxID=2575572 RepID=A0A833NRP5_UNCSA|nr:MAG: protease I [Candidatus Saganbacteria bacterium]